MKSIRQRILEKARKTGKFNSTIARATFKKDLSEDFGFSDMLQDSIMRRARELASDGMLKRAKTRGEYVITPKGRKSM
jgi:predicted transcriptional regulator